MKALSKVKLRIREKVKFVQMFSLIKPVQKKHYRSKYPTVESDYLEYKKDLVDFS